MVELDETTKAKVLKQIEFYFSDSNLPKDKFLRQQVEAHPEGYVDLSLIISFQRMRDVLKLGTVRPEDVPDELVTAVAGALQASQLMEVHSTGFQVRRKTALPSAKEAARAVDSRSLYVRPFPMHASLDQIVGFFQDAGVQLNAVRVRRHLRSRDFKGSVFVEASSVEEAQRVLGLSLVFEGAPLRMERKQHYLARKIAERKAKKLSTSAEELTLAMLEEMDSDVEIPAITEINKNVQLPPAGAAAAAANDEQPPAKKRKPSEGQSAAESADAEMADGAAGQQAAEAEAAEPEVEQYDAGCILMLTLQGQPAESDPYRLTKMIKEALGPDKIRFVEQQRQQAQQPATADTATAEQQPDSEPAQDMQQDAEPQPEKEGQQEQEQQQQQAAVSRQFMVRFRQPDQAQELLQAFAAAAEAGEHKQVAGCAAELRVVEVEEEEQYYKRAAAQRAVAAKRGESGGGRGGRGGGRGGFRGSGRGGRGGCGRGGGFRGGRGGRGRGRGRK